LLCCLGVALERCGAHNVWRDVTALVAMGAQGPARACALLPCVLYTKLTESLFGRLALERHRCTLRLGLDLRAEFVQIILAGQSFPCLLNGNERIVQRCTYDVG